MCFSTIYLRNQTRQKRLIYPVMVNIISHDNNGQLWIYSPLSTQMYRQFMNPLSGPVWPAQLQMQLRSSCQRICASPLESQQIWYRISEYIGNVWYFVGVLTLYNNNNYNNNNSNTLKLSKPVRTSVWLVDLLPDWRLVFLPKGRFPAEKLLPDHFWPLCYVHAPGKPLIYQTRSIQCTLAITHR